MVRLSIGTLEKEYFPSAPVAVEPSTSEIVTATPLIDVLFSSVTIPVTVP